MKQERYLNEDGTDTIDKWAATRSPEVFREIMFAQVEKYNDRLGKKDSIVSEVGKMADYMNRWLAYEKEWAEASEPNTQEWDVIPANKFENEIAAMGKGPNVIV